MLWSKGLQANHPSLLGYVGVNENVHVWNQIICLRGLNIFSNIFFRCGIMHICTFNEAHALYN